ncbi:similar to Saccharomyces cerevisiae YOR036W PEP12 Target membrane receptor (t-SNARE) for vesicular intermediates traveling between the Golgi apparatus and the vacuole [Geotrichum candidum]|uniref:Similar to Saccharomyces cerevisiae YOR036W PEP12 Target membrane receptor (t-SNARE) for vesicular intermediates traveling between the Golgi apparatus and the vacuole n=1 Tax=Geotrichum candidum TaxID=1173061 RepID=A0A0J9X9U9_GEOCN|nr:similar to Saccharomyces cerevisiae YOR036W PEP12 Target membrane receptor (t-SNARE) for vesicular intermediates traveling between the Golgi apparatus and the vacuole [Geotrichum candidum]
MSFADNVDLETQTPYSDSPEFDSLSERISTALFEVNTKLGTLQSHLKALVKPNASHTIEERAVSLADDIRNQIKHLGELVVDLKREETIAAAQRFTQSKLEREFKTALEEFQEMQRRLAEIQRKSVIKAKDAQNKKQQNLIDDLVDHEEENDSTFEHQQAQEQQELLNQHELDYQQNLIQEREAEIQDIEQGIEELNEIFTDLGAIVSEQGTIIDNIEANVYNIAGSTRAAATELTKAARYQRSSRGKAFCFLIVLLVILGVILLAVFLG